MKLVRFIPTSDGGSQFVDVDIPIDNAPTDVFGHVRRSATVTAQSTMLAEMPEDLDQDWHPASRRQLVIVLSGTVEVEVSDGTTHRWSIGEMFLADDVCSRGHRTRTIGGPARVLFVHLPLEATHRRLSFGGWPEGKCFHRSGSSVSPRKPSRRSTCSASRIGLKAPVEMGDGSVVPGTAGTPQGGVVSPVLADLFLHYTFDRWMARSFPSIPFERYADDIICHCRSEEEARRLWNAREVRFRACRLVLHPTKTKLVYCLRASVGANRDRGSQVRSRLCAGGRWIRTFGPPCDGPKFKLSRNESSASRSLGSPAAAGRQSAAGWSVLADGMA
jgi:hypothetical protein